MIKKHFALIATVLVLASAGGLSRAQTTNTTDTNMPAMAAAPAGPTPDAQGYNTGASGDAADASNTTIILSAPADLSDADKKDPAKLKTYTDAKKAYDDQQAQMKLEPLAVRSLDAVGHNRVAINFMWTLVTGFLVMFMQAGFALVETGLCRAKNAGHTMSMNFMIYPIGMLGFYLC